MILEIPFNLVFYDLYCINMEVGPLKEGMIFCLGVLKVSQNNDHEKTLKADPNRSERHVLCPPKQVEEQSKNSGSSLYHLTQN